MHVAGIHQHRKGVEAGVFLVQALLVCEQQQGIGIDQVGHQGGQRVVVAKADFIGDHGIVFVDDGHHTEAQQGGQRTAGVQVAIARGNVVVPQQHLCRNNIVTAKRGFIALNQRGLAHGRGRLQLVQAGGTPRPAQPYQAGCDRAAGNQHHLCAALPQRRNLGNQAANHRRIQTAAIVGQQRATHLDDPAPAGGNCVAIRFSHQCTYSTSTSLLSSSLASSSGCRR